MKKLNLWKRTLAGLLSLLVVAGTTVSSPMAASASILFDVESWSNSIDVDDVGDNDIIQKDAKVSCQRSYAKFIIIIDNETVYEGTDSWTADKEYLVQSCVRTGEDTDDDCYTLTLTAATGNDYVLGELTKGQKILPNDRIFRPVYNSGGAFCWLPYEEHGGYVYEDSTVSVFIDNVKADQTLHDFGRVNFFQNTTGKTLIVQSVSNDNLYLETVLPVVYDVSTLEEFKEAIANSADGDKIRLTSSFKVNEIYTISNISEKKTITVDFNGKQIQISKEYSKDDCINLNDENLHLIFMDSNTGGGIIALDKTVIRLVRVSKGTVDFLSGVYKGGKDIARTDTSSDATINIKGGYYNLMEDDKDGPFVKNKGNGIFNVLGGNYTASCNVGKIPESFMSGYEIYNTNLSTYTKGIRRKSNPIPISDVTVSDISDQTYTGNPVMPEVVLKYGDEKLTENTDYTVSYSNNTEAGTAAATINGIGAYYGSITKNFRIIAPTLNGSGTADDPYIINSLEDLELYLTDDSYSGYILLTDDIETEDLTIGKDTYITGDKTITRPGYGFMIIPKNITVTLDGVTISTENGIIDNSGTLNIVSGTINADISNSASAKLNISGGTVGECDSNRMITNYGDLFISGGTINIGMEWTADAAFVVTGGRFTNHLYTTDFLTNYLPQDDKDSYSVFEDGDYIVVMPKLKGISAENVVATYDGNPHYINVQGVPEDAAVMYRLNDDDEWSKQSPSFTNATNGAVTVYYKVEKENYATYFGSATITINKADIEYDTIEHFVSYNSLDYTGDPQYAIISADTADGGTLYAAISDTDTVPAANSDAWVAITDNNSLLNDKLARTNAGTYYIFYKIVGDNNHNDISAQLLCSFQINRKHFDTSDFTYTAPENLVYDGNGKAATVTANIEELEGNFTVYYCNESTHETISGLPTEVGDYEVWVEAESTNYGGFDIRLGIFEITPAASAVSSAPTAIDNLVYDGSEHELVNAGSATGGTMYYAVTDFEVETAPTDGWNTDVPSVTNAGAYKVWYKVVGDENHEDTEADSVMTYISTADLTASDFNYTPPENLAYDGNGKAATVTTTNSELQGIFAVEYSYHNSNVLFYDPPTEVGDYDVYANIDLGYNYFGCVMLGTFEITKAASAVSSAPTAVENLKYNGAAQALITAGTAADGTMYYAIDNTHKTINSTVVYVDELKAGNVLLPDEYTSSYDDMNFNRGKFRIGADGDVIDGTNTGGWYAYIRKSGDELKLYFNSDIPTITYSTAEYDSFIVTDVDADGVRTIIPWNYTNDGFGEYYDWSDKVPKAADAGTYTVYYKVFGDSNHNDTEPQTLDVTVSAAEITLTAPTAANNLTYNGSDQQLLTGGCTKTYQSSSGTATIEDNHVIAYYAVTDSDVTEAPADDSDLWRDTWDVKGKDAGTYKVWYKVNSVNDNFASTEASYVTVTIAQKKIGIDWSNTELTYNGTAQKPTATATGLVEGDTCTITVTGEQTDVGTDYTATAARLSNSNYKLPENAETLFTIKQASLAYTAPTARTGLKCDGSAQRLVNPGRTNGGTVYYAIDNTHKTINSHDVYVDELKAGNVLLPNEHTGPDDEMIFKPGKFRIGADGAVIDGTDIDGWYAYIHKSGNDMKLVFNFVLNIADKTYSTAEYDSFIVTDVDADGVRTIIPWNYAKDGFGEYYDWSNKVPTATDAGTYTVYYKIVPNDTNYTSVPPTKIGDVEIGKGSSALSVTLGESLVYDGTPKTLATIDSATEGVIWQFAVTDASVTTAPDETSDLWKDTIDTETKAGTYKIWHKSDGGNNYPSKNASVLETVQIAPKPVTITGLSASDKTYNGSAEVTITGTAVIDGAVEGDDIHISEGSVSFADAGAGEDKTVTFSGYSLTGDDAGNYTLSAQPASVTADINKAPLTVTAKDHNITYGDAPTNNDVLYDGFVNGEGTDVLTGTLDYDYSYSRYGNVGSTYTITPKGLTSDNYDITFANGTLNVAKKELGIQWSDTDLTYNGTAQKPTAAAAGLVNGDAIGLTVTGAQTDAGEDYTATVTAITGVKAGNYILPAGVTTAFSIAKANYTADEIAAMTPAINTLVYTGEEQTLFTNPELPNGVSIEYKDFSNTTDLAAGFANSDNWSADIPAKTNAGLYCYAYRVIGDSNHNSYPRSVSNDLSDFVLNTQIKKGSSLVTAPTANKTTRYSDAVELVNAGTVNDGCTMYYLVANEKPDADDEGWSSDIPTVTQAGTYHVWYKVIGNDNYEDTDVCEEPVTVTISQYYAPTYYSQTWTMTMDSYYYDGTAHEPTINGDIYGIVRYRYYNADTNTKLSAAPTEPGNYRVEVYASGIGFYQSHTQTATYSILNPTIDENGMADVSIFKSNNIIPRSEGKLFAGWFTDSTCTTAYTSDTGLAYAKFIDEKILTVKAQISSGTTANSEKTSIRFITSLDSLKYQNVGLKVTFNGNTIDKPFTKVYSSLIANGKKVEPSVFSKESHYLGSYTIKNIPKSAYGKEFTVTPYFTTQDGTVVEGATNTFTITNMIK